MFYTLFPAKYSFVRYRTPLITRLISIAHYSFVFLGLLIVGIISVPALTPLITHLKKIAQEESTISFHLFLT